MQDLNSAPADTTDSAQIAEMQKEFGDAPAEQGAQPVAEPAKKEEPKPEEKPQRSLEDLERNYKNLQGALNEERVSRREERRQREEMAAQLTNMQAVMRRIQTGEPEPEANPLEPLVDYVRNIGQKVEAAERETREQREMRELQDYAVTGERQFMAKSPDYLEAVNYLAKSRMDELSILLPDGQQADDLARQNGHRSAADLRNAMLLQEQQQLARQARQSGANPAELLYNIAQHRGYARKAAPAPAASNPIETVRRGQQATASLSGGGRAAEGGDTLSVNDLADLYIKDPAAADRQFNKMKAAGLFN